MTYYIFDLLGSKYGHHRAALLGARALLEALEMEGCPFVRHVSSLEDGDPLLKVIWERGLEGVVAKANGIPTGPP